MNAYQQKIPTLDITINYYNTLGHTDVLVKAKWKEEKEPRRSTSKCLKSNKDKRQSLKRKCSIKNIMM